MKRIAASLLIALCVAAPARAEPGPAQGELRYLPMPRDGWTMAGEQSRISLPIYLDQTSAAQAGELILALESAVSVMPEASTLVATVNGKTIGRIALGVGESATPIAIPPSVLKRGWNMVTLSATQRHRVDCTVNGTYELWSRIDPARSGFRLNAPTPRSGSLDRIAALSPDETGALPIHLRLTPQTDADFSAMLTAVGLVTRMSGNLVPVVDVDAAPAGRKGIDLALGSRDRLLAAGIDPALAAASMDAPQLVEVPGTDRALLVIGTANQLSGSRALGVLADAARAAAPSLPAGRAVGHDQTTLTLSDLGQPSEQFTGRLWQRSLNLRLPSDALIADYDSVTLRVSAGYAPELDPDNFMSLFVNGRLAATVPFGNPGGSIADGRRVEIPLSAFRPGDNELQMTALVKAPADAACAPKDQIEGRARFLILNTTSVTLPETARAARLPDLAATLGTGQTGIEATAPVRLALASRTPETLAAAATIVAKMAASAVDMPVIDATLSPPEDRDALILVGAAADLPARIRASTGIDLSGLAPAAALHAPELSPDALVTGSVETPAGEADDPLLEEWKNRVGSHGGRLESLSGMFSRMADDLVSGIGLAPAAPRSIPSTARLVVSQTLVDGRTGPMTIVTAPDASALADGVRQLVLPVNWARLDGETTFLDSRTDTWTVMAAERPQLTTVGPFNLNNFRLTTAAWFALNTPFYAGAMLLAALLFGVMTYATVRRSGVRTAP